MLHESSSNVPAQSNKVIPTQPLTRQNLSDQISAEQKVVSFTNELFGKLHVFILEGEEWFIANEVCKHIGHGTTAKAVKDHCRTPKKLEGKEFFQILNNNTNVLGGHDQKSLRQKYGNGVILINFSDLTRLISSSRLDAAEPFKAWIHDVIIPTVRETGSYTMVTHPATQQTDQFQMLQMTMAAVAQIFEQSVTRITDTLVTRLENLETRFSNQESSLIQNKVTLTQISRNTTPTPYSPDYDFEADNKPYLPSKLGAIFFDCSAAKMNQILYDHGLIEPHFKYYQHWTFTELGLSFRYVAPRLKDNPELASKCNSTSLRWSAKVVPYLRSRMS